MTFAVDTKVRPVVSTDGGTDVVAGVSDFALPFTVTNQGNSAAGSEFFEMSFEVDGANDFDMNLVRIYRDVNGDGALDGGDVDITASPIESISNTGSNFLQYLIVGNTPASNGAGNNTDTGVAGNTSTYHLIATAWAGGAIGDGALPADGDGNDPTLTEVVYADDAGTATGDVVLNGYHSDSGTFTTLATLGVAKTASDGTSGYHIPGDVVTYDIDVTNGDPTFPATNVIVTDSIPANTTYDAFAAVDCNGTREWSTNNQTSWVTAEPVPASNTTDIQCTILSIAVGGSETVTFTVTID